MDRQKIIYKEQHVFRTHLHQIYTETITKSALNGADDKRFIRKDGIRTYAWGHIGIQEEMDEETVMEEIQE